MVVARLSTKLVESIPALDKLHQSAGKSRCGGPVEDIVVENHRQVHFLTGLDPAFHDRRLPGKDREHRGPLLQGWYSLCTTFVVSPGGDRPSAGTRNAAASPGRNRHGEAWLSKAPEPICPNWRRVGVFTRASVILRLTLPRQMRLAFPTGWGYNGGRGDAGLTKPAPGRQGGAGQATA